MNLIKTYSDLIALLGTTSGIIFICYIAAFIFGYIAWIFDTKSFKLGIEFVKNYYEPLCDGFVTFVLISLIIGILMY